MLQETEGFLVGNQGEPAQTEGILKGFNKRSLLSSIGF